MAKKKMRIQIRQTGHDIALGMRRMGREEALASGVCNRSCTFADKRAYNRRRSKAELRAMGWG